MSCIKDWLAADRPREKLLASGPATLSDTELLALILRNGHANSGTSALDLARQLLARFGSLRTLVSASATELCQVPGIGLAKAAELLALGELSRCLVANPFCPGTRLCSSREVFDHFHERLRDPSGRLAADQTTMRRTIRAIASGRSSSTATSR